MNRGGTPGSGEIPPSPREEGAIRKDWGGRLPIAIIYPNSYYLGMSNLGIHAIYRLLNGHPRVVAERVFVEKDNRNPPLSVESGRPLSDFAVLAFSVSYELDYFNVVSLLKSAGIPLYAADRDERHPLIIGGGPCLTANPIPLSPFFDAIGIGEAEALLPDMLPRLLESSGERRDALLKQLTALPGIYVPLLPPENIIKRQWAQNLDDFPTTSVILTPDTELGDLYLIEAERGCQRGCRFCLVNSTFAPMRFRSLENLLGQAENGLKYRQRIGLVGPAVADHPQIKELLAGLNRLGADISVSSLRIGSLSEPILDALVKGNARTITLAPEAGSDRLRRLIKKGLCEDDIFKAVEMTARRPFRQLKLYFMLGLPTETNEDIEAMINLILAVKGIIEKNRGQARITVNIAPFVPKVGTPFQWLPMAPLSVLNNRLGRLKKVLAPKGIKVNAGSPAWSQVQAALSRGDSNIAKVLVDTTTVSLAGWRRAIEENEMDIDYYVYRTWGSDLQLPWHMIDLGTDTVKLQTEMRKAFWETSG